MSTSKAVQGKACRNLFGKVTVIDARAVTEVRIVETYRRQCCNIIIKTPTASLRINAYQTHCNESKEPVNAYYGQRSEISYVVP